MARLRMVQKCSAEQLRFRAQVPSLSDPEKTYQIEGIALPGKVSCSCPAYRYNGKCKHLSLETVECGWVEGSGERQTEAQRERCVCPRCGGRTVREVVGCS